MRWRRSKIRRIRIVRLMATWFCCSMGWYWRGDGWLWRRIMLYFIRSRRWWWWCSMPHGTFNTFKTGTDTCSPRWWNGSWWWRWCAIRSSRRYFCTQKPLSLRCSSIMMPLLLDRRVSNSPGVVDKDARSQDWMSSPIFSCFCLRCRLNKFLRLLIIRASRGDPRIVGWLRNSDKNVERINLNVRDLEKSCSQ